MMPEIYPFQLKIPYLNGVYIAIDAVPDAYLVVDGPYCVFQKIGMQKGHNARSTLINPVGSGRIAHTDLKFNANVVNRLAVERTHEIQELFEEICSMESSAVLFVASMDFHQLLDVPLEKISKGVQKRTGTPINVLKSGSLSGDWLDGYAGVLCALAENVDVSGARPDPRSVALVGNFFDRSEGDCFGNLQELKRIFRKMSLELCSVWLDGSGYRDLEEVKKAGTIFSLPYGREAGRILAKRLNVPHISLDLPVGLQASCEMVRAIGGYLNAPSESEKFIEEELQRVVPCVRELAYKHTSGRTAVLVVDPFLVEGMLTMMEDMGIEVKAAATVGMEKHISDKARHKMKESGALHVCDAGKLNEILNEADVVVSNTLPWCGGKKSGAWIPFGYPNYVSHPIRPKPFLGFEGFLSWAECIVENLLKEKWKRIG